MDASLEKVGTEGSDGAVVPGLRYRGDWFPRGTKESRWWRASCLGRATSRVPVAEGEVGPVLSEPALASRGSAWSRA